LLQWLDIFDRRCSSARVACPSNVSFTPWMLHDAAATEDRHVDSASGARMCWRCSIWSTKGDTIAVNLGTDHGASVQKLLIRHGVLHNLSWTPQYSDLAVIITDAWRWHKKRFG